MFPHFIPDVERLTQIFSQSTSPTFFLGAVAAFLAMMLNRLSGVVERIRVLKTLADNDPARRAADVQLLHKRAQCLNSAVYASLRSCICATLLLALIFVSEFLGLKYAYGASMLFILATSLLGFALFRFAQEAKLGLAETDILK